MGKKKVCVVLTSRAHYGRSIHLLNALKKHPKIDLQIVLGGSALINKYGDISKQIEDDGFIVNYKVIMAIEGGTPLTMAKTTGLGLLEFATAFDNLLPDVVVIRGDRFEMLAPAIASAYMNIPLVHIEGGDVTGTIDESVRHAITKLAHVHFPTNKESAIRIVKMGENPENIYNFGALDIEFLSKTDLSHPSDLFQKYGGVGASIDVSKPYLVVLQHPVTTEYEDSFNQINQTIQAISDLKMQTIWMWPNMDAGTEQVSKGLRVFREESENLGYLHFFRNLEPDDFSRLVNHSACLVGNSSTGVKEASFLGTPVVNIGTRQQGRLRAGNVVDVGYDKEAIKNAILKQVKNGKYKSSYIYGDGNTSEKIANVIANLKVDVQKRMSY